MQREPGVDRVEFSVSGFTPVFLNPALGYPQSPHSGSLPASSQSRTEKCGFPQTGLRHTGLYQPHVSGQQWADGRPSRTQNTWA